MTTLVNTTQPEGGGFTCPLRNCDETLLDVATLTAHINTPHEAPEPEPAGGVGSETATPNQDYREGGTVPTSEPFRYGGFRAVVHRMGVKFQYDTFIADVMASEGDKPFRQMTNDELIVLWDLAASNYDFIVGKDEDDRDIHKAAEFNQKRFFEYTKALAMKNRVNPVMAYLDALPAWETFQQGPEYPNIRTAIPDNFKAENPGGDPLALAVASGSLFVNLVRRALNPGCHAPEMVILSGKQGSGKSLFFQSIMPNPDWFDDSLEPRLIAQGSHRKHRWQLAVGVAGV